MQYEKIVSEDFPETWKPVDAGDAIEGEVIDYKTVTVKGEEGHLATLDTPVGLRTVWLNGVLRGKFTHGKIEIGDTVMIEYKGKRKSPVSRFEYNDYDLYKGLAE